MLDKKSFKVLKYIYKYSETKSYNDIFEKFKDCKNPSIDRIDNYLCCKNLIYHTDFLNKSENGDWVNPSKIVITEKGREEIESARFFNFDYFIKSVLVPIAIGVICFLISQLMK
jgi:hypothetical protein